MLVKDSKESKAPKKEIITVQANEFIQKASYKNFDTVDIKIFKTILGKINHNETLFKDFFANPKIEVLTVLPCSENRLFGIFITKSNFAICSMSSVKPPIFRLRVGVGIITINVPLDSI